MTLFQKKKYIYIIIYIYIYIIIYIYYYIYIYQKNRKENPSEVTFFSYMYYTSATWSLVGCLVAGFGVYPLMEPCVSDSDLAGKTCGVPKDFIMAFVTFLMCKLKITIKISSPKTMVISQFSHIKNHLKPW